MSGSIHRSLAQEGCPRCKKVMSRERTIAEVIDNVLGSGVVQCPHCAAAGRYPSKLRFTAESIERAREAVDSGEEDRIVAAYRALQYEAP